MPAYIEQFSFRPDVFTYPERVRSPVGPDVIITGSSGMSPEQNQAVFGSHIAALLVNEITRVKTTGKTVILDLATGSSPKSVWEPLARLVDIKGLNLSDGVIITGHEQAFGPYQPNGASDFDGYRRKIAQQLGIMLQDITDPSQISGEGIAGNFLPMHQITVSQTDFPDRDTEKRAHLQAAQHSAAQYNQELRALTDRSDVVVIGLYGVGTDGHIGEAQINMQGFMPTLSRRNTFVYPKENNSVEQGLFYWMAPDGSFYPENNIMWRRGLAEGEKFGRTNWQQGYGEDTYFFMGLGWRDMLRIDHLMLAFNNESKTLAFQLALQGAFNGAVADQCERNLFNVSRKTGEGEKILDDLSTYVQELECRGIIPAGTTDKVLISDMRNKCGVLFQIVYSHLDTLDASFDDAKYSGVYEKMWEFANRYIGYRAPVARLIYLRSILSKKTTIVLTPEVVKGTEYEVLLTS